MQTTVVMKKNLEAQKELLLCQPTFVRSKRSGQIEVAVLAPGQTVLYFDDAITHSGLGYFQEWYEIVRPLEEGEAFTYHV